MTETTGNEMEQTGTSPESNQGQEDNRTFSQGEVDKIVQQRLEKYKKRFADVDMNEYKSLKAEAEERELDAMKKREEFDGVLAKQKEKYQTEINTLRNELTTMKVDGTLLAAASARNAVNPDQVSQLLRSQVGLDETGRPVVYDANGGVMYDTETSEPKTLESLVGEFLDTNSHFVRSGPSGVNSSGSQGNGLTTPEFDLGSLDMNNAADREKYKQLRAAGKI